MKAYEINVGDKVLCKNQFGLSYTVLEKFGTVCTLEHRTGQKEMHGGKWIDEVYTYKGVRYSQITKVIK